MNSMNSRKRYDSQFKARVALEAIQGHRTLSEIGSNYGVHPNQERHPLEKGDRSVEEARPEVFADSRLRTSGMTLLVLRSARASTTRCRSASVGALSSDRPTEGRTGMAQKKLRTHWLTSAWLMPA